MMLEILYYGLYYDRTEACCEEEEDEYGIDGDGD